MSMFRRILRSPVTLFRLMAGKIARLSGYESARASRMRQNLISLSTRAVLNERYHRLSSLGRERFYLANNALFLDRNERIEKGTWRIELPERTISLPLQAEQTPLHWATATAILGHDRLVKESYLNAIRSARRPDLFLDVGANYGTHSLIFLGCGIPAITFEPNPVCADYFLTSCKLNGLSARLEQVAVGDAGGTLKLAYPEDATWFGSADPAVVEAMRQTHDLKTITVPMVRLDDYLAKFGGHQRIWMKIDVEGLEEKVILGATALLRQKRPVVIFESNDRLRRASLAALLRDVDYGVAELPWTEKRPRTLSTDAFLRSRETNFLAVPAHD